MNNLLPRVLRCAEGFFWLFTLFLAMIVIVLCVNEYREKKEQVATLRAQPPEISEEIAKTKKRKILRLHWKMVGIWILVAYCIAAIPLSFWRISLLFLEAK